MLGILKNAAILILVGILAACSHTSKTLTTTQNLSPEEQEQINYDALDLAAQQLDELVAKAQTNSTAATFLASDLFLKANMSLMESDYVTAAVLFRYVAQLAPQDEFVQKKFAISLIRVGDLEQAQTVLEKLYKKSLDAKVGLILAGVYTGLDQEVKAREVYKKILAKNPKNEDACVFLSKSYAIGKQVDKAFALLNTCANHDPKNGMYDYYAGKIYLDQNKNVKAIESFKRAITRQSGFAQAVTALGMLYEEKEQFDPAIELYERHLKKQPFDSVVLARVVHTLFIRERFQEVIPYAERLSDLEPENLNLKVKLGILYTDAKKYSEALSVFKDLLGHAPQSDKILYYLGAIYQEMGQLAESIDYFNQIPVESGLYMDSSVQMANMLSTLAQNEFFQKEEGQWKDKFVSFSQKKIEEIKEMKVEFSVILSGYYEAIGQHQDAMVTMEQVLNEKSFSTQHKYYLANLYEKEKKFVESTSLVMGILEKEPKNAEAWNFLGYTLLVRGDEMERAFECIQKAYKLNPNDGYIRDSLGWYYYKTGDVKRALKELKVAVEKAPGDVEILKHLAIIYRDLKDYSRARSYMQEALKNARYQTDRQDILISLEEMEKDRLPASKEID